MANFRASAHSGLKNTICVPVYPLKKSQPNTIMDLLAKSIDFLAYIHFVELVLAVILLIVTVCIRRHLAFRNYAISHQALILVVEFSRRDR